MHGHGCGTSQDHFGRRNVKVISPHCPANVFKKIIVEIFKELNLVLANWLMAGTVTVPHRLYLQIQLDRSCQTTVVVVIFLIMLS